jgi:site-specific DNA-methyltransferase (adenine-specific)
MNKHLSEVTNEDCMEGMARYPDKYFDLAIVDPPYGIKVVQRIYKGRANYINPKDKHGVKKANHNIKQWDNERPNQEYWNELFRVSKNQIVWGANYFTDYLPVSRGWIFWDKDVNGDFSKGELAWTSFDFALKKVLYVWDGMRQGQQLNKTSCKGGSWKQGNPCGLEKRNHPTQKPILLYNWIINEFAKQGDKILDTHLGSGSSRIAAYEMGYDFTAFELDTEYFEAQEKRYKAHIAQLKMELV